MLAALATAACITPIDDPENPSCNVADGCNGVEMYCFNDNFAPANDGGNYWYDNLGENECEAADGEPYQTASGWYCQLGKEPLVAQGSIKRCVEAEDGFDPNGTGFNEDGYPALDDEVKQMCSARCAENHDNTVNFPYVCQDANWTDVKTANGWNPSDGLNCNTSQNLNVDDPDGSEVPWDIVGGPSSPVPLPCDLDGDCVDEFYPHVGAWILTPFGSGLIEPETRNAHYLGIEATGSQLEVDMFGSGAGIDDTEALFGQAEYTAVDCGSSACPFFLANLSAYNTTDEWDVLVSTVAGRVEKSVSDVQIDLVQSTLGSYNTALDVVAFAPGALRLRVEATVSSCPTCDTTGDGVHALIVENEEYVFAEYDDGELTIDHEFDVPGGTATLTVTVEPDEHPPNAKNDLTASEACDEHDGLMLDANRSLSSDDDNDIDIEFWWVDGTAVAHGTVIGPGVHTVAIEARDERDAWSRSDDLTVTVGTGGSC